MFTFLRFSIKLALPLLTPASTLKAQLKENKLLCKCSDILVISMLQNNTACSQLCMHNL